MKFLVIQNDAGTGANEYLLYYQNGGYFSNLDLGWGVLAKFAVP